MIILFMVFIDMQVPIYKNKIIVGKADINGSTISAIIDNTKMIEELKKLKVRVCHYKDKDIK